MEGIALALIVSLVALGAVVLVGVLGYLIDKNSEPAEDQGKGNGA